MNTKTVIEGGVRSRKLEGKMYVLYVDIMGFKDRVMSQTHQELTTILGEFRTKINSTLDPFFQAKGFKMSMFSDSILIVSEDSSKGFNAISKAASEIMRITLEKMLPVKGVISKGMFTYDGDMQLFFGRALVDAYLLHEQLYYYGIVAHHSLEKDIENRTKKEPNAWVHSPISWKKGCSSHYHIAYNLVSETRTVGKDTTSKYLKRLDNILSTVSGEPRIYIDKTIAILKADQKLFKEHSDGKSPLEIPSIFPIRSV